MTNIMAAHQQWASRPVDERYWNTAEALMAAKARAERTAERTYTPAELSFQARIGGEIGVDLVSPKGRAALDWASLSRCSSLLGVPGGWLADGCRDTGLAASVLTHGLRQRPQDVPVSALAERTADGQGATLRDLRSEKYVTIADTDVLAACDRLRQSGTWMTPPARPSGQAGERKRAATPEDILPGSRLGPKAGDIIAPAGVYYSRRDLFVMLVSPAGAVDVPGTRGMFRFALIRNSEIAGVTSFRVDFGLLEDVCGNHILWGAKTIGCVSVRHVGQDAKEALRAFDRMGLAKSVDRDVKLLTSGAKSILAPASEGQGPVIDAVWSMRIPDLTREALTSGYERATRGHLDRGDYAAPNTALGMVQGITEWARDEYIDHADKRAKVSRAAGAILEKVAS